MGKSSGDSATSSRGGIYRVAIPRGRLEALPAPRQGLRGSAQQVSGEIVSK